MVDAIDSKSIVGNNMRVRFSPWAQKKMTLPTHLLAGLIIGKITGDYATAITGSLVMDLDHAVSYFRHGILFKPKQLFQAIKEEADPWGDQRNFMHSIFSWVIISILLSIINFHLGLVFSLAYFFHLVFDALDSANFYPFFPFRKFAIKGFVKYFSKQEIAFDVILLTVFILI